MTYIFSLVVVLGVLIFVHELGHFLVARLCGVGVEKFSLGFGPRIFGKKIGITDYQLSSIPLGGYVKMIGEEPDADIDPADISLSFTHKHVLKRIMIVAAGPVFNLLLAIAIFFGSYMISGIEDVTPFIRNVKTGSPAQHAGLKQGDYILSIDDVRVESWYDITNSVERSKGNPLYLQVRRDDSVFVVEITPVLSVGEDIFGDAVEYYDMGISGLPELAAVIGGVTAGFPAQKAGLKEGDKIFAINGREIESWNDMRKTIASAGGKTLHITVLRGETFFDVEITPKLTTAKNAIGETENRYLIGISTAGISIPDEDKFTKRLNPFSAFRESIERAYFVVEISLVGIVKMIKGDISPKNLGGPIMIVQMAGDQAKEGAANLIYFIAFISINLAMVNFLPIPVLDGGHLLFFSIELLMGRPVNIRTREIAQQVGVFILLMLMVFVFYNDINRIWPSIKSMWPS